MNALPEHPLSHHFQSPKAIEVVHRLAPGRLRAKIPGLYRSEARKADLEGNIAGLAAVASVRANVLTGTVLIYFDDSKMPFEQLLEKLQALTTAAVVECPGKGQERDDAGESPWRTWLTALPDAAGIVGRTRRRKDRSPQAEPPREDWHVLPPARALALLGSCDAGLAAATARERLRLYGANVLEENRQRSPIAIFAEQFFSVPVGMLAVSAAISVATGGILDALVIGGVVLINSVIGYLTETSAERTINALGTLSPTGALVIRDGGRLEITVADVAVGDLLVLSPGSYVPADARLLESNRLTVDESALTGESLPVNKDAATVCKVDTPLADRVNMVHMGTVVTGGSGLAVVTATGHGTQIGQIQSMVGAVAPPETPMQRQLDRMGMQLAALSGGICVVVFGIGILRGYGWVQMLGSCISLAVAAVPEGLPAVATTTLALGINQMRERKVLIRQLSAVESLGSVQVLCLDKTGTLTMNRMKVVAVHTLGNHWDLSGSATVSFDGVEGQTARRLLEAVTLCSEVVFGEGPGQSALEGSPTECALVEAAIEAGVDVASLRRRFPLLGIQYRADNHPYMVSLHGDEGDQRYVAVKGSPAEVLDLCGRIWLAGAPQPLTEEDRGRIAEQNEAMAGEALRVLGVAFRDDGGQDQDHAGKLVWLGLIGMEDSLRPGMGELMDRFHHAGIQTVMITGDQSATAYSVGKRLHMNHTRPLEIVDSVSLDRLEPEILASIVGDTSVFARVSPAHKLKIVQAYQHNGRVVAMTGDGINDGPALKAADVGVAMGQHGADVARSVADVVLEDDNLHTMVAAVEQGRTIYANIRKSLRFLLSTNLSEIEVMLLTTALGWGEALNPMQLLWINLLTDIFPALALALEPPESNVLNDKPRDPGESIIRRQDFMKLVRESSVISAGCLAVYATSAANGGLGARASTNAFMTLTISQLLHAIACRSQNTTVLDRSRAKNPYLTAALTGSLGLQLVAAVVPQLRRILRMSPLGLADLALITAGAGLPFLINEGTKSLGEPLNQSADHTVQETPPESAA